MKRTERSMHDGVAKRVWTRVTRGWKECTLEMADRAIRESVMIRKDCDEGGEGGRKIFTRH